MTGKYQKRDRPTTHSKRDHQRFSVSQMSRDQPMEQREQKPNLFGLCRVVTEEDEAKLAWAMPWRENEGEANVFA